VNAGPTYDYLRDPGEIYAKSFALVRDQTDLGGLPPELHAMALRLVHSCAMPDIVDDLAWHGEPADAAARAIRFGAPIFVDAPMVGQGIIRRRLPDDCDVICTLDEVPAGDTTRSAAAVDLWLSRLDGAVAVFGNAPTALFHLLERLHEGAAKPAAILAFPVGFVGAAESKQALIEAGLEIPFVTLKGRRGGSAMAAAAVNAVTALSEDDK
jgi:precorrin-8X/cobalt-precorrin-8 methylmutase